MTHVACVKCDTCSLREGWENVHELITITFGFTSEWSRSGASFLNQSEHSKTKPTQWQGSLYDKGCPELCNNETISATNYNPNFIVLLFNIPN